MDVPDHVRALRKEILEEQNGRRDDVEFTFVKGRWNHLGEATLMNRIKSHQDVGERWYPELLKQLREQHAKEAADKERQLATVPDKTNVPSDARAIEAH